MITKILIVIKALMHSTRPQTQSPKHFAQQAEFIFGNDFIPSAGFQKNRPTFAGFQMNPVDSIDQKN